MNIEELVKSIEELDKGYSCLVDNSNDNRVYVTHPNPHNLIWIPLSLLDGCLDIRMNMDYVGGLAPRPLMTIVHSNKEEI